MVFQNLSRIILKQGSLVFVPISFPKSMKYTNGSSNQPKFLQDIHDEFWKLANEIAATRPTFEIASKSTTHGVIIPATAPMLCIAPSPAATETVLSSDEKRKREQLGNLLFIHYAKMQSLLPAR